MKTTLLILSILLSSCSFGQLLEVANLTISLPNNVATLDGSSSLAKVQACGPDTNGYFLAKATSLQALNINNATSASSIGQYLDAPQTLIISGVSFYAYKIDLVGGVTMNATVQIFNAGADSLPIGTALATTTVSVDTNFYAGDMALLRKHATFTTPVTVSGAYIVVITNATANPMGLIFNSWTALDGGQEWLADVRIGANWLRSYDVNVGGAPFDADGIFEPHVSYSLDANFMMDNQCFDLGNTVNFTNTSTPIIQNRMYNQAVFLGSPNLSYEWNFGDASPVVNSMNASHTYAMPAPYTVTLTDDLFGWSATCTDVQSISLGTTPTAVFFATPSGFFISIINSSIACPSAVYLFDFGDGSTSSMMNPTHTYASAGTYTICLTVADAFGSNTTCQTITVVCAPPTPGFTSSVNGLIANFTNTSISSLGATYLWDFGDGTTSTVMHPLHTYALDGTYTVCLSVNDQCGFDSICQTIVIDNCVSPTAGFSISGTSPTYTFSNTSAVTGSTTYAWDFGDGTTAATMDATHTYTTNGTFSVTLVIVDSCGGDQIMFTVTVAGIGLEEISTIDLRVYPNPTTGHFSIEASQYFEAIEITDLTGKIVHTSSVLDDTAAIQAEHLASGTYVVSVRFSNRTTQRVRIEVVNE
jgi:PKD repeat protein